MQKTVLVLVIVVILIAVIFGVYFLLVNSNRSIVPGTPGTTQDKSNQGASGTAIRQFEIQGMKVGILKEGSGVEAKTGNNVTINYVTTLESGKEIGSSIKTNVPTTFKLGANRVIKGWELGILGMKVGEKRKLTVPPELAFGSVGLLPTIPPNATLIYEIELLKIGK